MPRITGTESQAIAVKPLAFSPIKLGNLGSSEYTIGGIAIDDSSSIQGSLPAIRACIAEIVKACAMAPRADSLLLRPLTFASNLIEVHPFKELKDINPDDYISLGGHGGNTALNDAAINVIHAVGAQGKELMDKDYSVNGIVIVITDGEENVSTYGMADVKKALAEAMKKECLESLRTILVGVSPSATLDGYLKTWKDEAGFDQYVAIADASQKSVAKLAEFVSKSFSAQSNALGSGGASKQIPLAI